MGKVEDEEYSRAAGWRKRTGRKVVAGPWEWYRPPLRGAYYTLTDAVSLQRSLDNMIGKGK